ncbi:MAG TPA: hypothetical protein VMU13_03305 [Candidatus Paceibacterota bacterium]|nr:hypothetical protein [Candidatus Paceibacterota bacterium]
MAKDYFQDIVPPSNGESSRPRGRKVPVAVEAESVELQYPHNVTSTTKDTFESDDDISTEDTVFSPPRGIRNINMPTRPRYRSVSGEIGDVTSLGRNPPMRPPRKNFSYTLSYKWIWLLVLLCVLTLGFLSLFLFRQTTVTITPHSQALTFDQTAQFMAYPAATAATGTLAYTVAKTDISASETVASNGTTAVQTKASGSITVYNAYSASSITLIKNTRFQTPSGLIFRTPDDIVIPGKHAGTPGSVTVTVEADQTGPQYNIGPVSRFTVPGLQSQAALYAGVYAQSLGAMSGGASGTQAGVSADVRQSAINDIRSLLAQRANQFVTSLNSSSTVAFSGLSEITFSDAPDADATSSQVVITENAHVAVPIFASNAFAAAVAQTMAIDTNNTSVTLVGGNGYSAQSNDTTPVNLGTDPLNFSLVGSTRLVWMVDTNALAQALAGRDQSMFQTTITGFPGVEAARARIEPFWKNTFPSDPNAIKIIVTDPASKMSDQSQ